MSQFCSQSTAYKQAFFLGRQPVGLSNDRFIKVLGKIYNSLSAENPNATAFLISQEKHFSSVQLIPLQNLYSNYGLHTKVCFSYPELITVLDHYKEFLFEIIPINSGT